MSCALLLWLRVFSHSIFLFVSFLLDFELSFCSFFFYLLNLGFLSATKFSSFCMAFRCLLSANSFASLNENKKKEIERRDRKSLAEIFWLEIKQIFASCKGMGTTQYHSKVHWFNEKQTNSFLGIFVCWNAFFSPFFLSLFTLRLNFHCRNQFTWKSLSFETFLFWNARIERIQQTIKSYWNYLKIWYRRRAFC